MVPRRNEPKSAALLNPFHVLQKHSLRFQQLSTGHKTIMGIFIVAVVIVILIAARSWVWNRSGSEPLFESADDMMQYSAGKAVNMAGRFHGVGLDYSEKSIMNVENILGTLHQEYRDSHSKEGFTILAIAYGSYIGEVIRRGNPGVKWERDHPVAGQDTWPLHWKGGEVFPCFWCCGRIINGPEDNVWHKYIICKQQKDEPK